MRLDSFSLSLRVARAGRGDAGAVDSDASSLKKIDW
jgi:hypothetical protein